MTKKQKKMLIRILCSFVLLVAAAIVEKLLPDALPQWGWLLVFLAPYLLIGYDVLKEAVESIAPITPTLSGTASSNRSIPKRFRSATSSWSRRAKRFRWTAW